MDNPNTRAVRTHLEIAASACGVNYGEFARSRGIKDFLLDAQASETDPYDLAALALEHLIAGDAGQMDFAVCMAAIGFLDERYGVPREDEHHQRHKDLATLAKEPSNRSQYKLWRKAGMGSRYIPAVYPHTSRRAEATPAACCVRREYSSGLKRSV